ncbi:MAG TPA: hypothetical protein VHW69_08660 [Rhizomicrobium sp.]|jgi:hypothetical protein|nr:hypothetical protein [Rhizomicrobium sp.]
MEQETSPNWAQAFVGKGEREVWAVPMPEGLSTHDKNRFLDVKQNAAFAARRRAERQALEALAAEAAKTRGYGGEEDDAEDTDDTEAVSNLLPSPAGEPERSAKDSTPLSQIPLVIPNGSTDVLLIAACAGLIEHMTHYIARTDSAIDACTNFMDRICSMMKSSAEVAKVVGRLRGLEPEESRHRMIVEHAQ